MSSEIVPAVVEGIETSSAAKTIHMTSFRPFDLLDLRSWNPEVTVDLTSTGNYHKYVNHLNPTPESVMPLLDKIKAPTVLLLRGCESLLRADFPFGKFETLNVLEISGISHMTTLPEIEISGMTQLQTLNLSHLPIKGLPDDLFSNLINLSSLVLRGCSRLGSLPRNAAPLVKLEHLDLSDLPIETLPVDFFSHLQKVRRLVLRGCYKLSSLPSLKPLESLEDLDLSHCTSLRASDLSHFDRLMLFQMLDISYTNLHGMGYLRNSGYVRRLYLRGSKVRVLEELRLGQVYVLDLSGAQYVKDVHVLERSRSLLALDLSRTGIETIESISDLRRLRILILRQCTGLVRLPAMQKMTEVEVLDVSGCVTLADLPVDLCSLVKLKELSLSGCSGLTELREGLFDGMLCLEKLDLSKNKFKHLPSLSNLVNLRALNISLTPVLEVPGSSNFHNFEEMVHQNAELVQQDELHLVSTLISESVFDRFKYGFARLEDLISIIESKLKLKPTNVDGTADWKAASCDINVKFFIDTSNLKSEFFKRSFGNLRADLKYIEENMDLLESSGDRRSIEGLLLELMTCTDVDDDEGHLQQLAGTRVSLTQLLRMVAKLKQLVPPKLVEEEEEEYFPRFREQDLPEHNNDDITPQQLQNLRISYESLTEIQRNCLLYFAAFGRFGNIHERILIQLWYGEGFIDPVSYETGSKGVENPNTIEENGRQVLKVLLDKGFIERSETALWSIDITEVRFVRRMAKAAHFFDLDDNKNGLPTPRFSGSQRACLLRSQDDCPSSSNLWLSYSNSSEKMGCFRNIHTLLYINEPVIDIKAEWFSKMRNLSVICLGPRQMTDKTCFWSANDHAEVMDLMFLEELKNMKQLRLLNMDGFAAIIKVPDSVCRLTNLRMLSLRYCSNLEELPAGFGRLANLTHLDMTQCHLLHELPKGVSLLSRLEVLKGFAITYLDGGGQHRKACTLGDLLGLKRLRKLTLVVNKDAFPDSGDLHVLDQMKSLYSLKITWKRNYNIIIDQEPQTREKAQRWRKLKCWEQVNYTEGQLRSNGSRLCSLKKLALRCFPLQDAPNWLNPSELQNLEKLYIMGGSLKTLLSPDTNQSSWNVKTLNLRYLRNLEINWEELRHIFPHMTRFLREGVEGIKGYPGGSYIRDREWKIADEQK